MSTTNNNSLITYYQTICVFDVIIFHNFKQILHFNNRLFHLFFISIHIQLVNKLLSGFLALPGYPDISSKRTPVQCLVNADIYVPSNL